LVLGASNGLVALRRADEMLRIALVQAPLMLGLGSVGAWQWGVVGAAYGFAAAQAVGLLVCWAAFLRADPRPRPWVSELNADPAS
jgi:Na+-driven multidrug efflux pump